ncbi:hypothetical protein ACFFRR_000587 [Megaselia abdita]
MSLRFSINNKLHEIIPSALPVDITLLHFIRDHALLTGTKYMCLEAGCGTCVVSIKRRNPATFKAEILSVNSCLTLLNICNGWEITTVEGLGDKRIGYHPVQKKLASMNGSQCGFCSPGMVINMYSLLVANNGRVNLKQVEDSFSGNLCRCTGYRPILDAMKSFAFDAEDLEDIEDLSPICKKKTDVCRFFCSKLKTEEQWFWPATIQDIFEIFPRISDHYMLVGGNTAHGAYRRSEDIRIFIDINNIPELHAFEVGDSLTIGGNVTLTNTIHIFREVQGIVGFEYCEKLADHFELVANVPVRNMGTLAGNIMLKKQHLEFPSDIFLLFEAVDARINIISNKSAIESFSLEHFLSVDANRIVISSFTLPKHFPSHEKFNSYKVTWRSQNAHAIVNGAFLFKFSSSTNIESARICFGGINPSFVHAKATEIFLKNKNSSNEETVQELFRTLLTELNPDWFLPDASPQYRRYVSCGIFYKFILSILPSNLLNPKYLLGARKLYEDRPLSNGLQVFQTNPKNYPLTQPIVKQEALVQCSGEAKYNNDLQPQPNEVHCAFVQSKLVGARIELIDPSTALSIPKVISFFSAKDIPGVNSFTVVGFTLIEQLEEMFVSDTVLYYDQPLGVIVAETMDVAVLAAKKVKVVYSRYSGETDKKAAPSFNLNAEKSGTEILNNWSLRVYYSLGGQYHFPLEPNTTVCVPQEDSYKIYCSTQWMDFAQASMARVINVPVHTIQLETRRVGGSYGFKSTRANLIACTALLVSHILNRPARFIQTIESMMETCGKRFPYYSTIETTFSARGRITTLSADVLLDGGCSKNDNAIIALLFPAVRNGYNGSNRWSIRGQAVSTDAPSNTIMRAPGNFQGVALIENLIENISFALTLDSADVRLENLSYSNPMTNLYRRFLSKTEYKLRLQNIVKFNQQNLWRKKGIATSIMEFSVEPLGIFQATVVIYHSDGTVAISHGGIDMGQGLNTKVLQVAAFTLGIPLTYIKIEPSNTVNGANSIVSANSTASEGVCFAVRKCCQTLLVRLEAVRKRLPPKASWESVIEEAYKRQISLIASDIFIPPDIPRYKVYGCACSEVEYDVLTGSATISRVDIIEDTGESLSPLIDIGQIEGAFVMGLGYWFLENLIYDRQTGRIITNRTWNYKVPGAKDIPVDFRVELVQLRPSEGFLRAKATGEPATCLAISAYFAARNAIAAAREDLGLPRVFLNIGPPSSPENNFLASEVSPEMFKLK